MVPNPERHDTVYTTEEVAALYRVSVATVRRWIRKYGLPAEKPGGDWRIRSDALQAWVADRRHTQASSR